MFDRSSYHSLIGKLVVKEINVMHAHVRDSRLDLRFGIKKIKFKVKYWDWTSEFGALRFQFLLSRDDLRYLHMGFDS